MKKINELYTKLEKAKNHFWNSEIELKHSIRKRNKAKIELERLETKIKDYAK